MRFVERTQQWVTVLEGMVREINEPDPPPSFQTVKVWVGTWNMGNAPPNPAQLRHWLGVEAGMHELYAVSLLLELEPPEAAAQGG